MAWRIGEVTIEDEFYPGRDLYSDGDVEEELLEIAMSTEEGGIDSVIAERKSWPVMYHFSPVRENILEWYPVNESDKVLEIGAGCGAVTGALAKRAGSVTCVDLSKRRSLVNAWRHRDFGNITIKLGNFEDVEKVLDRDYTLITLIGVFEYACGYVDGPTPYVDFLKKISEHLAPGG